MIITKQEPLNERIIKAGYTGASLAQTTGISRSYISQILNGKRTIMPPTAKKICEALNCSFDDVFEIAKVKS